MADEESANNHPETSASTPNSNQHDGLQSGTKAPKDRSCPFCGQAFTSSSLGRHLDLYIKPRNPKPPDGVHDVDEIRKIRGNITRRQPRTGARSSVENGIRDDGNASATSSAKAVRAPSHVAEDSPIVSPINAKDIHGGQTLLNHANWQATGVINNIPPRAPSRNASAQDRQQHSGQTRRIDEMRTDTAGNRIQRPEYESESMWRLQQDAELGRAAEMALREVLGSLEAANKRLEPKTLFEDFDFYSLSFPGLCLAILHSPRTLFSPTPFPCAESWSLSPPGNRQYDALVRFVRERSAAKQAVEHIPDSVHFRHHAHLSGAWEHWQAMSDEDRSSAWTLEILRSFTRAQEEKRQLRSELETARQRTLHLEAEYDRLSRCQLPREYLMHPPNTIPIPPATMREVRPVNLQSGAKEVNYDVEVLLSRWRSTIRATTRPPKPSQTHPAPSSGTDPVVYKEVRRNELQDDMIMNGSVWNVNGPVPRARKAHTEGSHMAPVNYETPTDPGNVLEENADEDDATGEEDVEAEIGQYGGYGQLVKRNMTSGLFGLNGNGKRPLASEGGRHAAGPKMYRAHD